MRVLTVNVGSSSLKLAVWEAAGERALVELEARGIGDDGGATLTENGERLAQATLADHVAALFGLLQRVPEPHRLTRVGHRVVHGGDKYRYAVWLNETVLAELQALVPLSPLHQPPALAVIQACRERFPALAQAAVFDTAFHGELPPRAYTYAIPAVWRAAGVRRYGFHGIACADVVAQLGEQLRARAVILHLGAGCSATAVSNGCSIDTTMGFTPLEGLMMATRSGDIDPGALIYMQREQGLTWQQLDHALNEESGLLGLSGQSANMGELAQRNDEQTALTMEVFCYRAAKAVGGLAIGLGGLDQLIFSGGIGERSAVVRIRIAELLKGLGAVLDPQANAAGAPLFSAPNSAVELRVVAVDEGRRIAQDTAALDAAP